MVRRFTVSLIGSLALAACGQGPRPQSAPAKAPPAKAGPARPRPAIRPPAYQPPPAPKAQPGAGLEGVIGADRDALIRLFGTPRLDGYEGDVRKLQFAGSACVLDVYLYPPAAGREPQASYVEARRSSDGLDVDDAACVAALRGR